MWIYSAIATAAVAAVAATLIKQYKPEYSFAVILISGAAIMYMTLRAVFPLMRELRNLLEDTGIQSAYFEILLKTLGIGIITQLSSEACKDCGQTAISGRIEAAGKAAIIIVGFPLFRTVLNIAKQIIEI